MKCNACKYEDIEKIQLYDYVVEKCKTCNYIRVTAEQYLELVYNAFYTMNVGNIKSFSSLPSLDKRAQNAIKKFNKYSNLSAFKTVDSFTCKCNVCMNDLVEFYNIFFKKFHFFFCPFCNSIYFKKEKFIEFMEHLKKASVSFNLIDFLKEIFLLKEK